MSVVGLSGWVGASTFRSARARQNSFEFSNNSMDIEYVYNLLPRRPIRLDSIPMSRCRHDGFIDNAAAMC
jgi:hypothetical protein